MKKSVWAAFAVSFVSSLGFSASVDPGLASFFSSLVGQWQGTGAVNGAAVSVTISVVAEDNGSAYIMTTQAAGAAASTARYEVGGEGLVVVTTQYSDNAQVKSLSAQELWFTTSHQDQVTGRTVGTNRDFTLDGNHLRVVTEVSQDGTIVRRSTYDLERASAQP